MPTVKLIKDFDIDKDLTFDPVRKTNTGSRIIDVRGDTLYQTGWMKVLYDVEYTICLEASKHMNILASIDEKVVDHCSDKLPFSRQEILQMYRPLLRTGDINRFTVSPLTGTVMYDKDKNTYNKAELKTVLKPGHYIRFIFGFNKVYLNNHELKFCLELRQIEKA